MGLFSHLSSRSQSRYIRRIMECSDCIKRLGARMISVVHRYLFGFRRSFWMALIPFVIFSVILYTRGLNTNFIFDEQEAILANPYLNGNSLSLGEAIHRDFWGLAPDRSIGSYRPIPNLVWRSAWEVQQRLVGVVNVARTFGVKVAWALQRPQISPGWFCWPNLLFALTGLSAVVPMGVFLGLNRGRGGGEKAVCVSMLGVIVVTLVTGTMGWIWYAMGGWVVVGLSAAVVPVLGPGLALLLMFSAALLEHGATSPVLVEAVEAVIHPWPFHWINVVLHGVNAALLVMLIDRLTDRRGLSWVVGMVFVTSAVLTEAVTGVVGIADVLGGLGALLALLALVLPLWAMPFTVFGAVILGLFSKESAVVLVGLIPFAALVLAPLTHKGRNLRWVRAFVALGAALGALVLYAELRRRWFPAPVPEELRTPLADGANVFAKAMHWFRGWFHQGGLPKDPINNPLVDAPDFGHRVSGALRVFFRGLVQLLVPWELSADYSAPQEPVPPSLYGWESLWGGLAMVGLPIGSVAMLMVCWIRERRLVCKVKQTLKQTVQGVSNKQVYALISRQQLPYMGILAGLGMMWVVAAYFPHSNIPVLLPTVRAERFWYFPAIGSSIVLAVGFSVLFEHTRHYWHGALAVGVVAGFVVFQAARARSHAMDYADDLTFWDATRRAVPRSAKAHLNYSVMWGARGRLDIRLRANEKALELAPGWMMANIYYADTLCRLHRTQEGWPYYLKGFEQDPAGLHLIALSLQCLWDEKQIEPRKQELQSLAQKYPGSWLAYLITDTLMNGKRNNGVDPKYRPRGYNEGPRK